MPHAAVSFIKEDNDESESNIEFLRVSQKEFPSDVWVDDKLSPNQQNEVTDLLQGFSETLSDLPGRTRCIEHKIRVVDDTPFRIRQYPLPVHLKKHFLSEPILQVPDMSKPFVVQSDASNKALGAVLLQEHEGFLLPCFYASRRLLVREINYAIIEKETLGIVFALNKFSKYLLMRPFYIQTDHKPLSFLNKNKSRSARLTRWALSIQQYSFTVQHIRGVNNVVSDALSRIY